MEREPVSSDKLAEVIAGEAEGFYHTVVTVATAFLGGSLFFLERIVPRPAGGPLVLLR